MKKLSIVICVLVMLSLMFISAGCLEDEQNSAERTDREDVNRQQELYQDVQPIPFFDYSIPRDVLIQIYQVVTTEARSTYSVITSMTGEVIYAGASVGYAIPADTQLTNPLKPDGSMSDGTTTVEQAEPNGLFSSKNTDGTWVLFVNADGTISPIYTEQKVTTFPYVVVQNSKGIWVRADEAPASFTVDISK